MAWPVSNTARAAEQDGTWQKVERKWTPFFAIRSNVGVLTDLSPQALACGHAQLSASSNSILGRVSPEQTDAERQMAAKASEAVFKKGLREGAGIFMAGFLAKKGDCSWLQYSWNPGSADHK
jgi:hypothetical protein